MKKVGTLTLVPVSNGIAGTEWGVYDEDGEYQGEYFGNPVTATEEEIWEQL